jgi:hypothetical protein
VPANEWIIDTSGNSLGNKGDKMEGKRFASMLLPAPGGPFIKILEPIISNKLIVFSRIWLARGEYVPQSRNPHRDLDTELSVLSEFVAVHRQRAVNGDDEWLTRRQN